MKLFAAALVFLAVAPAFAHHPFTPHYDASKPVSMSGVVVELRTINPHVVLVVEGTGPDGRSGRWAFEGFPLHSFTRQGQDLKGKLTPGTRVRISGWAAKDAAARAFSGREVGFADGSTMVFGPTPQEGDRWSCGPGPCGYRYPDPGAPAN